MTRLFDSVIDDLRKTLLRMGGLAESILEKAVQSVWERKADLAAQVRQDDLEIDRLDVQIDERVCGPWHSRPPWRRTCAR